MATMPTRIHDNRGVLTHLLRTDTREAAVPTDLHRLRIIRILVILVTTILTTLHHHSILTT
jgi:hypothetical protein